MKKNIFANKSETRGYIMLLVLVAVSIISSGILSTSAYIAMSEKKSRHSEYSRRALSIADAGIDKAIYQLNQNNSYSGETNSQLGGGEFTTSVSIIDSNTRKIISTACIPHCTNPIAKRTVRTDAKINTSVISFRYGVQVGAGGISIGTNAKIIGNVFSNGNIAGSGEITGDAILAGTSSISGVSVSGKIQTNSLPVSFPIGDDKISEWKTIATSGGTISGPYNVQNGANITLGPKAINGDMTISNNGALTLTGPVWVKGNINISNNGSLKVSPATANNGAIIIADDPANTINKGVINISNNAILSGNGNPGSYPMIISMSSSTQAIQLDNNATSVILYAPRGTIAISNNAGANELTGYKISMSNNSTITYKSGLGNIGFSDGPGGSWEVVRGTYLIVK